MHVDTTWKVQGDDHVPREGEWPADWLRIFISVARERGGGEGRDQKNPFRFTGSAVSTPKWMKTQALKSRSDRYGFEDAAFGGARPR